MILLLYHLQVLKRLIVIINPVCLFLCQNRVHYLEAEGEQSQRLGLQLEMLKKEKARLVSQLTAQESVIDGLRAERRIWGQELAQQGEGEPGKNLECISLDSEDNEIHF